MTDKARMRRVRTLQGRLEYWMSELDFEGAEPHANEGRHNQRVRTCNRHIERLTRQLTRARDAS